MITIEINSVEDAQEARKMFMTLFGISIVGDDQPSAAPKQRANSVLKPNRAERGPVQPTSVEDTSSLLDETPETEVSPEKQAKIYRAGLKKELDDLGAEYNTRASNATLEAKLAKVKATTTTAAPEALSDGPLDNLSGEVESTDESLLSETPGEESLLDETEPPAEEEPGESVVDADRARVELRKLVALIGRDGAAAVLKLAGKSDDIAGMDPSNYAGYFATCADVHKKVDEMVAAGTHTKELAAKVINIKLGVKGV